MNTNRASRPDHDQFFGEPTRQKLTRLCEQNSEVECAYLFGSHARGTAGVLSDVDLGILFTDSPSPQVFVERMAGFAEEAEQIIGLQVDLTDLNTAPLPLLHRVIRDGVLLFARDHRRRLEFETRAIREFLDFQPVLDRYDRLLFTRARAGRLGT